MVRSNQILPWVNIPLNFKSVSKKVRMNPEHHIAVAGIKRGKKEKKEEKKKKAGFCCGMFVLTCCKLKMNGCLAIAWWEKRVCTMECIAERYEQVSA